jgi:hypothetical protein
MSKVTLVAPLAGAHGKVFGGSDMWIMQRYKGFCTGHKNHPRDYNTHPQSEAERAGILRLSAASKAYNQVVKGSPEWQNLEREWLEQKDLANGKCSIRGYFISQYMKRGN